MHLRTTPTLAALHVVFLHSSQDPSSIHQNRSVSRVIPAKRKGSLWDVVASPRIVAAPKAKRSATPPTAQSECPARLPSNSLQYAYFCCTIVALPNDMRNYSEVPTRILPLYEESYNSDPTLLAGAVCERFYTVPVTWWVNRYTRSSLH